jgi:hypothetical protein
MQLETKAKIIVQQERVQKQTQDHELPCLNTGLAGDRKFLISETSAIDMALKLKKGAIEIFKTSMQGQLDIYQAYIDKLFNAIQTLPDNQPMTLQNAIMDLQ